MSINALSKLFACQYKDPHLHAIDQWILRGSKKIVIRCGHDHPVMIRLLNRFEDEDHGPDSTTEGYWKQRWHLLESHQFAACEELSFWINKEDGYTAQKLHDTLVGNEAIAFLGTRFTPTQPAELEDILEALLYSGTPIALLPRAYANDETTSHIEHSVRTVQLLELPAKIKELRNDEEKKRDHTQITNHLTLLWDDPTRVPRSEPLIAP
ncbi:MAG: hypothetical protein R2932_40800 [Caldilineaceae bacterium]